MAIFDITNEKNSKMYFLKEPKVLKEKYFNFLIKFLNKFYKNINLMHSLALILIT